MGPARSRLGGAGATGGKEDGSGGAEEAMGEVDEADMRRASDLGGGGGSSSTCASAGRPCVANPCPGRWLQREETSPSGTRRHDLRFCHDDLSISILAATALTACSDVTSSAMETKMATNRVLLGGPSVLEAGRFLRAEKLTEDSEESEFRLLQ
ncbi:hypothetical protein ON010_g12827 [Phytophthora cinnamomi]|nr:hypothetical protein ON010_g12827 [Phytophthora cinnamomi]